MYQFLSLSWNWKLLEQASGNLEITLVSWQVRVSTVDGFQGAEADLVLFSAVRANLSGRLGFLRDTRRANVALTRARRGLVVFADATTLRESKGSVWATWLEWLEARDGIRELDELYQDVLI